jgi:uncharacterized protein (DUF952 family)
MTRIQAPEGLTREGFVRAALGLTQGEATSRVPASARDDPTESPSQRVVAEKQSTLRRSSTLELIEADVTLDDVGGLEVLKAWLRDAGARVRRRGPRRSVSPSLAGCSSAACRGAASRSSARPRRASSACPSCASTSPTSSRCPSPEHAIREATRVIEAVAPVVLWVDEIEKGLGAEASSDARQARVFGAFLTWLQERRAMVFVAATANDVERLPPELSRRGRFDEIFFVDLPSVKERQDILRLQLKTRGRDPALRGRRARRVARALLGGGARAGGHERALPRLREEARALRRSTCAPRPEGDDAPGRALRGEDPGAPCSGARHARGEPRPTGGRSSCSKTEAEAGAMRWLFHVCAVGQNDVARYAPASLAREGFVHASFLQDLEESARLYFPKDARLEVLQVDPRRLDVRVELTATPRGPMPHIQGPIPRDAIRAKVALGDFASAGFVDRVAGTRFGFVAFEGMTLLDLVGVYDPLSRVRSMGFDASSTCGDHRRVTRDPSGRSDGMSLSVHSRCGCARSLR